MKKTKHSLTLDIHDRNIVRTMQWLSVFLLLALIAAPFAQADVSLPGVFGDNMVLQRGMKVPVWGTADAGERVSVTIGNQNAETTAGRNGRWMVKFGKMDAGGPFVVTVKGRNSITFSNVMVGEVWVCSGQSNMGFRISNMHDIDQIIASADFPNIRMLSVDRVSTDTPQDDLPGKSRSWVPCSPETIREYSAVAYFFGKKLHQELNVPVGLVNTSWGGSVAEAWVRVGVMQAYPALRPLVENLDSLKAVSEDEKTLVQNQWSEFWKAYSEREKKPLPAQPPLVRWVGSRDYPSGLFNAMIAPLIPYGIRGAIWYQGESNAYRAYQLPDSFSRANYRLAESMGTGRFPVHVCSACKLQSL